MRNAALDDWGNYDRDDPFPLFAEVRTEAPVHPVTLADGHRAWLVVRYPEAKAALNDPRLSKDMQAALAQRSGVVAEGLPGPAFSRHMLNVDPPDHSRLRKAVASAFSQRRIEGLRPRVQAIVDELFDRLVAVGPGEVVDLVAGFAFPLPFTVISELLGVPDDDRLDLGCWFTTLLAPSATPEPPPEAVEASARIVAYLGELLDAKRSGPGDDLVSELVRVTGGEDRLTRQEMLSTIFQLVVAGHDTTTSLIGNGTVALLLHPGQRDLLAGDPSGIPGAVEEFLRYDAPVPHSTFRYTTEAVEIGGVVIPAREQVLISLASANRDPGRFADPESLDLTRGDPRHLAFGHGIHFCLGAPLARMEGRVAFATMLRRFPAMRLATEPTALRWMHGDGLVLRGLSELPVVLDPAVRGRPGEDARRGVLRP